MRCANYQPVFLGAMQAEERTRMPKTHNNATLIFSYGPYVVPARDMSWAQFLPPVLRYHDHRQQQLVPRSRSLVPLSAVVYSSGAFLHHRGLEDALGGRPSLQLNSQLRPGFLRPSAGAQKLSNTLADIPLVDFERFFLGGC